MSLLRGVYSGQGDTLLAKLRHLISAGIANSSHFPLDEIVDSMRGERKSLSFDEDFIENLLKTQKEHSSCFSILALLFPDLDFTQSLDIDHLHPKAAFTKKKKDGYIGISPEKRPFYENPENWNGIVNLHLLNSSKNKSKQDEPLDQWMARQVGTKPIDLLIPNGTDLSFEAFEQFISARAAFLKQKLQSLVNGAAYLSDDPEE